MNQYKINFGSITWNCPQNGVRFKCYKQKGQQIRLVEFCKEYIERAWCTKEHIGYILSGEMEIDFNGRIEFFETGDGLFIPSGDEHGHKVKILSNMVRIILIEKVEQLKD